ncbi:cupredoxin domain-containing protein [Candidatus Woesebacteria bacterium]|nr:cupredoxin domain-containing protein [Candidatus Woesebacteria bacterium]
MEDQVTQAKQGPSQMVIVGVIILIVVMGGGYLFMRSQGQEAAPEQLVMEEKQPTEEGMAQAETGMAEDASDAATSDMMEDEVQIVTVEAGSFYFKPNEIRVKKGQKVRIVMNSVSMMHDFVIDELGVKLPVVKDGDTGEVEFVASTAGSFEYYCSVGQHRAQGQVGTLIVEE